jgi:hypothetical protein
VLFRDHSSTTVYPISSHTEKQGVFVDKNPNYSKETAIAEPFSTSYSKKVNNLIRIMKFNFIILVMVTRAQLFWICK